MLALIFSVLDKVHSLDGLENMTALPQPALYWNYENHHACLWGLGLCLLLLSSTQVQELIINKDPTLLDNFLDVSDQPGDKVKGR